MCLNYMLECIQNIQNIILSYSNNSLFNGTMFLIINVNIDLHCHSMLTFIIGNFENTPIVTFMN
jgi:hypothetical protein